MHLKIYEYKNCSTCKAARKFAAASGHAITSVDITATPPTTAELRAMLARYDGQLRKLFNTSGQDYRALGLAAKLPQMQVDEALALLGSHGKLVKRPFLVIDGHAAAVGFAPAQWQALLQSK